MAFSVSSILNSVSQFFSGLRAKNGESVIGVDIGTSSVKIVQVAERRGVALLETYGEIALGPYASVEVGQATNASPEKVSEALNDLIREANVTAKTGGIAIPLSASLINVITLPTKDPNDLATMIPIEARKYIPVPVSEVALDWFVIPEEEAEFLKPGEERKPNTTDALLVAIHNQALSRFDTIAKGSNLTPSFYEVEPFSMARSAYDHGTAPVMVIDLGASSSRIYIIEFGIIDVSHTVNRGGQDITLALAKSKNMTFEEAENEKRRKGLSGEEIGMAVIENIFSEARRILLTYQRKEGKAVSRVILAGGGASLEGITGIAPRFFDAQVTVASPFDKVSAPAFISGMLKSAGPSFTVALGLALRALKS